MTEVPQLAALIAPVSLDDFCSTWWRMRHLLCGGPADRLSDLLSWPAFNRILERHWRDTSRFRIACEGRDVDKSRYIAGAAESPHVRPDALIDLLRCGATLAFHAIDEIHEPLAALARSFEAVFQADTQINVYASWRSLHGLDVHRDDEEVFVLHVHGRKRWLLYGFGDARLDRSQPAAGAILDTVLSPGAVLYIPRGCYHLALPMNEPTLHLTVGVAGEPRPQPTFSLPWSATADRLPPGRDFSVRLLGTCRVKADPDSRVGAVTLVHRGRSYRFPSAMQPLVAQLESGRAVHIDRLIEASADRLDEQGVRTLLAMLVKAALAEIAC